MLPDENDGSEQPSSSDAGVFLYLRTMMREEFQGQNKLLLGEVQRIIRQEMELVRKLVKEDIQKFLTPGTWNEVPEEERSLHLKFLDEVSGPVLTNKEFKGIRDGPLKVALFDAMGDPVTSGPESSEEVEIVLSNASGNDTTNEDFERKLIRAGEKGKPHFPKNVYVKLVKGEGVLSYLKLGQGKDWTKTLTCRLGAMIVDNSRGLKVQNAWTEPFEVKDNRGKLYEKHEPPFLTSEVWRLKKICRDGKPCRRLRAAKIETVQDLLFLLSVDPKRLKEIVGLRENRWNTIEEHAKACIIDNKRMYYHESSTKPPEAVIYDSVGELKGLIIDESNFVPIYNLSADKKDHAGKLLLSLVLEPDAFAKRYGTFFDNEASLLRRYPLKSYRASTLSEEEEKNTLQTSAYEVKACNNENSPQLPLPCLGDTLLGGNAYESFDTLDFDMDSLMHSAKEVDKILPCSTTGFDEQIPGCSMDLNAQVINEIESNAIKKRKVEASLLQQINPYKSSTNCTIQQSSNPIDPSCPSQLSILDPENIHGDISSDTNDSADIRYTNDASGFHQDHAMQPYKSSGDQQFAPSCSSQFISHNHHASGMELDQEEVLEEDLWAELDERGHIPVLENINKNIGWNYIGDI